MIDEVLDMFPSKEELLTLSGFFFYNRARLTRLIGDVSVVQQIAKELVNRKNVVTDENARSLVELGHLALQQGDLAQAQAYFREGLHTYLEGPVYFGADTIFDALALLAARQKWYDLAIRLFGSRWCRGYANLLSPIEKEWREGDWTAMREALGEERFEALYEEGQSITFQQFIELVQAVLDG